MTLIAPKQIRGMASFRLPFSAGGLWLPFVPPNPAGSPVLAQETTFATTSSTPYTCQFLPAPTAQSYANVGYPMPLDWDGGNVFGQFFWYASSASLNSVVFGIQGRVFASGDSYDQAPGAAQEVTTANTGTNGANYSALTPAITLAGPTGAAAAGLMAQWVFYRRPAAAGDTLAATARVTSVLVHYTRA